MAAPLPRCPAQLFLNAARPPLVRQVDCTAEVDLCRKHYITAFPSIRIFRHGSGG